MTRRAVRLFLVAGSCLVLPVSLAACTTSTDPSGAGTATTTAPAESGSSSAAAASPTGEGSASPPGSARTKSPAAVVTAYYAAINAGDYRTAWDLGGSNLSASYDAFVAGFSGLERDDLTILGTDGDTVAIELEAVQTDGSTKSFRGEYTVRDGEIVGASIHEVPDPGASEESSGPAARYENCTEAHRDGAFDIRTEDPAYRPELDRDKDGLACEPDETAPPAPPAPSSSSPPSPS